TRDARCRPQGAGMVVPAGPSRDRHEAATWPLRWPWYSSMGPRRTRVEEEVCKARRGGTAPNYLLETNRRPASPLEAGQKFPALRSRSGPRFWRRSLSKPLGMKPQTTVRGRFLLRLLSAPLAVIACVITVPITLLFA